MSIICYTLQTVGNCQNLQHSCFVFPKVNNIFIMAARFQQIFRSFSTSLTKNSITNDKYKKELVESITVAKNGSFVAAWHPDVTFPYESSKPIPKEMEIKTSTVIKEDALKLAAQAFKSKHPEVARQELMRLTHTTKHRWFPRSRDKKAKDTPMDRPYL